jgi:RND family efflux transporter MFP subunit
MKYLIICLLTILVAAGCNRPSGEALNPDNHGHGEGSLPFTLYSGSCEYFAEIEPLVKNQPAGAAIHVTRLTNHKPFAEGSMTVRVLQNGELTGSGEALQPRIPGIFPVTITPSSAGEVSLEILFTGEGLSDSVSIPSVIVFENRDLAEQVHPAEEQSGLIRFTKEMAWKIDFHVMKLVPREFSNTIRVSGELMIPPSEIAMLNAKSDGILVYRQADLVPGVPVRAGDILFTLTGRGLTSRNIDAGISGLKNQFEASRTAYEREKALVADRIVSQKQFNETVTKYRTDSVKYFAWLSALSDDGMNIIAASSGFVYQVYQSNGSFVTEGTPLIAIGSTNRILLRADLPQRYWQEAGQIASASFRPSGSSQVFDISSLDGKLIAAGSAVTSGNQFIPVTFEFRNSEHFVAGSFAEVFLHTTALPNQLVIPASALLEEQGSYYVYLQAGGESYIKRTVRPGFIDGTSVNILSGLAPGGRVVTRGAIFIKAASQMTGSPSHGHEH